MSTRSRSPCGVVDERVRAAGHTLRGAFGRALEHRHLLAREDERGRALAVDVDPPRLRGLVGVGRADHPEPGHRPHRREVLDRLVRRAVLAETDGVVRPDERGLVAGERGEAGGGAHRSR